MILVTTRIIGYFNRPPAGFVAARWKPSKKTHSFISTKKASCRRVIDTAPEYYRDTKGRGFIIYKLLAVVENPNARLEKSGRGNTWNPHERHAPPTYFSFYVGSKHLYLNPYLKYRLANTQRPRYGK